MSWGAVAKTATDQFKQGYQDRKQTRDANDPTGGGFAGAQPRTPQPAPAPTPQQAMPQADPMTVGAQPAAPAAQQSPLVALLHMIWQRPTAPQPPAQ